MSKFLEKKQENEENALIASLTPSLFSNPWSLTMFPEPIVKVRSNI